MLTLVLGKDLTVTLLPTLIPTLTLTLTPAPALTLALTPATDPTTNPDTPHTHTLEQYYIRQDIHMYIYIYKEKGGKKKCPKHYAGAG